MICIHLAHQPIKSRKLSFIHQSILILQLCILTLYSDLPAREHGQSSFPQPVPAPPVWPASSHKDPPIPLCNSQPQTPSTDSTSQAQTPQCMHPAPAAPLQLALSAPSSLPHLPLSAAAAMGRVQWGRSRCSGDGMRGQC